MNTTSKILVIIFALLIEIVIYFCFKENIDFERETRSWATVQAMYNGNTRKECSEDGCEYKYIYNYSSNDVQYQITSKTKEKREPPVGAIRLVKYDTSNPTLAFFTRINVIYLFYLIEIALLFVVLWVCFSRRRKVTVIIDGDKVAMDKPGPNLYFGQAIISIIFTFICLCFYLNMANTVKTFNPIDVMKLTNPAGLVLIALLILGIFMTIWSYKRN